MSAKGGTTDLTPAPRASLKLDVSRRRAAILFRENGLTLRNVPTRDGNSLIHAITRSLGLVPQAQWTTATRSRWTRIIRSHLARYCSSVVDRDYLNGDQHLGLDHALLITRLWRIRTLIYPCSEQSPGNVMVWPALQYPFENDNNTLIDVHIVGWSDLGHFDILEPSTIRHFPHTCALQAEDLHVFEHSGSDVMHLFDCFLETWLQLQFKPTPASASVSRWTWASLTSFIRQWPIGSWMTHHRFRSLSNTVGVFACSAQEIPPSFLTESGVSLLTPDASVSSSGNSGSINRPFTRCVFTRVVITLCLAQDI